MILNLINFFHIYKILLFYLKYFSLFILDDYNLFNYFYK